jgi:hypothetical protein
VPWSEDLEGRDRSLALGKAVHAVLEDHFEGRAPDWLGFPGQVAASGVHLLPLPSHDLRVERAIGTTTGQEIAPDEDGRPRYTVTIGGVPWLGYVDLSDPRGVELGSPVLYDYKSTKSIKRYAKTPVELEADLQANLYAYDLMTELRLDLLDCRWIYFETDRTRKSEPRDFTVTRPRALDVIETAAEDAKLLDSIDHIDQAPMNTNACADFGGCEYHEKVGGPCSARVAIGALIQARVPKPNQGQIMPLDPSRRASLHAQFSGNATGAATQPPATTAPAAPPATEASTSEGAPPPPPPPAATEAPASPRTPARAKAKNAFGGGTFAQLAEALTAAEAIHAQATAELEAAKDNMRKALA